jgi:branched-chain amino acid transport system permease protein
MSFASQIPQYLVSGLTLGSVYGMIALGFTLIYNATGIVNFAQGEFVTYGALIAISGVGAGLPIPLAVLVAMLAVALLGAALERGAIRPARRASVVSLIIITIGASMFLQGMAMKVWGQEARPMPHFSGEDPILFAGAAILPQHLWVMGVVMTTMLLLWALGEKTQVGKAMRACAINRQAAQLCGIPVARMVMLSFALSGLLGGLAGAIVAPLAMGQYNMGVMLGLKGFAAAILGGMGNPMGAVLGGLVLGSLESLSIVVLPSGYKDAVAFAILLIVLLTRPSGLLGRRARQV